MRTRLPSVGYRWLAVRRRMLNRISAVPMRGDGKRGVGLRPQVTAPIFDATG
jgi:hypothetical protein